MVKTIDIIVPVYNEENTLREVIKRLEETDFCGLQKRLIFVDDASSDNSYEILKSPEYAHHLILSHKKNAGKGKAITTAFEHCSADIVAIQDADLEYNPNDYKELLPFIINDEAKVVYGSRLLDKNQQKSFLFLSLIANKFLTFLTNLLYGSKITDMETCYKAFSYDVIKDIKINARRFDFEPEITAKILKKGVKIKEVPISYNGRLYAQGKKVTAKDAVCAIFTLFRYRFFD